MIDVATPKKRRLVPKKGDAKTDMVWTPLELATSIVRHFQPGGHCLEPCRGDRNGPFYQAIEVATGHPPDWFEITEGRDFLKANDWEHREYDWIITNPPWSLFPDFLIQSMKFSRNVVFLAPVNAWWTKKRQRDLQEGGFGIIETALFPTPAKPWPQSGFQLAATWIRRGWKGGNSTTHL